MARHTSLQAGVTNRERLALVTRRGVQAAPGLGDYRRGNYGKHHPIAVICERVFVLPTNQHRLTTCSRNLLKRKLARLGWTGHPQPRWRGSCAPLSCAAAPPKASSSELPVRALTAGPEAQHRSVFNPLAALQTLQTFLRLVPLATRSSLPRLAPTRRVSPSTASAAASQARSKRPSWRRRQSPALPPTTTLLRSHVAAASTGAPAAPTSRRRLHSSLRTTAWRCARRTAGV